MESGNTGKIPILEKFRVTVCKNQTKSEKSGKNVQSQNRSNSGYLLSVLSYSSLCNSFVKKSVVSAETDDNQFQGQLQ